MLLFALSGRGDPVDGGVGGGKMVPMFTLMASIISAPDPHLPDAFKNAHRDVNEFKTMLKVCLDQNGSMSDVTTMSSVGDAATDEIIAKQIRDTWRYKPQPLPVCFVKPIVFKLSGATGPTVEPQARALADVFAQNLVIGDRHAAYEKLTRAMRAQYDEAQFGKMLDCDELNAGKVLEAKWNTIEVGFVNGVLTRTAFYAIRTSKQQRQSS